MAFHPDMTAAALTAVEHGWHVFPVTPRGKYPLRGFTAWEQHASADPEVIRRMWTHRPNCNVGIACGPSGLLVIDLDMPKPGEKPPPRWEGARCGADALAVLADAHGQPYPSDTRTVTTRSGGTHLYFTPPPGRRFGNSAGRHRTGLGWLIDTRGHGGYVLAAGSHVSAPDGTGPYTLARDLPPAPLPGWLADLLTPKPAPAPPAGPAVRLADLPGDRLPLYARAALDGEIQRVITAPDGGRNHALNLAAWKLGKLIASNILPRDLAEQALQHAAEISNQHSRDPKPAHALTAVIGYGIDAGMRTAVA